MLPICFVTGASSFVARALVPRLARTHRLRLLLRPGQQLEHFATIPHERVEGRLGDAAALRDGLRGVDRVVHLAAVVSFAREDHPLMVEVNSEGTEHLLALAADAQVRRFLHVSTICTVGWSADARELDERAPFNFGPLRIGYCDSKRAAEQHAFAAARDGLDVVVVNPPSMYGAGDRRKGDGSLLGAVMEGRVRIAPPGGTNVANVEDVCAGMVAALERGRCGERYILGGENLTGLELIRRIAKVVGGAAPRRAAPRRLVQAGARALRLKELLLGSRPPVTSQVMDLAARYMWYSSAKADRELDWRAGAVDPGIRSAWDQIQGA